MQATQGIKFLSFVAAVFVTVCVINPAQSQTAKPTSAEQLATLGDQFIDKLFELNPIAAMNNTGEERYEDKFVNDLTPEFRAAETKLYVDSLKSLKRIDVKQLSAADRVTYDVFEYRMRIKLDENKYDFYRTPVNQFNSRLLTMVQLASTKGAQPFRTVANYQHFLTRLDGFPAWVDSAIANMREGVAKGVVQPKILMVRVLAQIKTQMVSDVTQSGFFVPVKNFPQTFSEVDRTRLTADYHKQVEEKMLPAVTKLYDYIANEYLPHCRDTAGLGATPNGAAKYAYLVREMTTTNLTPNEIHALGLKEVARIRAEMEQVRKQISFAGDLNALLKSLPTTPQLTPFKTEDEVIEAFKKIQQRVEPTLDKLFSQKPRSRLEIRPEPEITRATAAAHYNVGSRDGIRPGAFYAPVTNALTYSTPAMTALFLHEALPGHHYQISLALESDLSRFRRYSGFTAYIEGWGLYAEGLGKSLGVYDDPYQYLGRLIQEIHRGIRLVVDTGMHAKGWTREQAIAYALENEGGLESYATQETERYMANPAQALAYKIGELKILELRARAEKKLGTRFDIREFHKEILNDGSLPLAVLEKKMDRWMGL